MRVTALVLAAMLWACHGPSEVSTGPSAAVNSPPALNITGVVRDLNHQPLRDATVTIADGPAAGLSAVTDPLGQFALSAPTSSPLGVSMVIAREGYATTTMHVMNAGYLMIFLQDVAFAALTGPATLSLVADAACTQLPLSVRARSYDAVVATTSSTAWALKIELSGTDFYDGLGTMFVNRGPDSIRFAVYSWDAAERLEDFPIVERLTPTSHLALSGAAVAPFPNSQQTIRTSVDGTFSYCAESIPSPYPGRPPTCAVQPIDCTSTRHQLTFTRR